MTNQNAELMPTPLPPTPRTDAKEKETSNDCGHFHGLQRHAHYGWKLARQLERELIAATTPPQGDEVERVQQAIDKARSTGNKFADAYLEARAAIAAIRPSEVERAVQLLMIRANGYRQRGSSIFSGDNVAKELEAAIAAIRQPKGIEYE